MRNSVHYLTVKLLLYPNVTKHDFMRMFPRITSIVHVFNLRSNKSYYNNSIYRESGWSKWDGGNLPTEQPPCLHH